MNYKYLSLAFFVSILCTNVFTQPIIKKQRVAGGNGFLGDNLTSIYVTKDGGVIAGGYSSSNISGEKTENSRGLNDYWIVKYDNLGNIQWDKTIGGSSEDFLYDIKQTSDGGYILGGQSFSNVSGEKTENSIGLYDYWIIKLDAIGNIQWDKTIGGNKDDVLFTLQQTNDDGYILGGYSFSNMSGQKSEDNRDVFLETADYWVLKIDNSGKIQWDKTIGGNSDDILSDIQQTKDGGYILGGESWSDISAEKTENSRGMDDYWIVKLDSLGNIQWDKTIGGSRSDGLRAIQQTCDNGYILGGSSQSNISGEKTENNRDSIYYFYTFDYWIVKLDSLRNIQWDKTIGGNSYDIFSSLQQTKDGGYILGGYSTSNISGEKTENSRNYSQDYWVIKLDRFANIQWDKTIGGDYGDFLSSVREIEKNRYVLGGSSASNVSGDKTIPSRGGNDYWLVGLNYKKEAVVLNAPLQITNSLIKPKNNADFITYPNPVKDILHIQVKGVVNLSLINQAGKTLFTKIITDNCTINVEAFAAGIYYLKNSKTGEVKKIIITK